jgi:hypothetical protein
MIEQATYTSIVRGRQTPLSEPITTHQDSKSRSILRHNNGTLFSNNNTRTFSRQPCSRFIPAWRRHDDGVSFPRQFTLFIGISVDDTSRSKSRYYAQEAAYTNTKVRERGMGGGRWNEVKRGAHSTRSSKQREEVDLFPIDRVLRT